MSYVYIEIHTRQCYCTVFTTFRCNCTLPYRLGKETLEEMGPMAFPAKQSVTFYGRVFHSHRELSGDRKSSIADGWKTGASDNKRWWRGRVQWNSSDKYWAGPSDGQCDNYNLQLHRYVCI